MKKIKNAPQVGKHHRGAIKSSNYSLTRSRRNVKNAVLKGTFFGSLLTFFIGASMIEGDTIVGMVVMFLSLAYIAWFVGVNASYLTRDCR